MIHFISDLHLSDEQPHLIELFSHYLSHHTSGISQLYILGDLFEVWIGDDYQPEWIKSIQKEIRSVSENGAQVYFCHGNRDFLVGDEFTRTSGCQLLPEYHTVKLGDHPFLLCHGDSLCIDDLPYQEFRAQVRSAKWQSEFLSLPSEQRLALVNGYREQSKAATAAKTQDIMDVNEAEVTRIMEKFQVNHLIHGHTHRPNIHEQNSSFRLVLSDWRDYGQFVTFTDNQFETNYFDISGITESSLFKIS